MKYRKAAHCLFGAILLLFLLTAFPAFAAPKRTCYINPTPNAIRHAIADRSCQRIQLAPGIYREHNLLARRRLEIQGAGADVTIIDGEEKDRIFRTSGWKTTISDVTLRNGRNRGNGRQSYYGGAISTEYNLEVRGVHFENNIAVHGGAIGVNGANVRIVDSTFTDNSAQSSGGALVLSIWASSQGAHTTIENCTFENNIAGDSGGAIDSQDSSLAVLNSRFVNNATLGWGGAILVVSTIDEPGWPIRVDIRNSAFYGNQARIVGGAAYIQVNKASFISYNTFMGNKAGYVGGAMLLSTPDKEPETLSLNSNTIERNTAPYGGGVFAEGSQPLLIHNSTLARNRAAPVQLDFTDAGSPLPNATTRRTTNLPSTSLPYHYAGGGIFSTAPTVFLNSTISGNGSRGIGGGIFAANSLALSFVTLADNKATEGGGNLYAAHQIEIKNTILQNGTPQNCFVADANSLQSRGGNLSSDSSCALWFTQTQDRNRVNTLLGPLAKNGGETRTRALLPASPAIHNAIDCGNTDDVPVLQDQRGFPRAEPCDTGAYQVQSR